MSYRNDHEAALARVDALEEELRRARADDAEQAERISTLEAELGAARAQAARAEAELAELRPPPKPKPPPIEAKSDPVPALVFAGLVVAIVVVAIIAGRLRDRGESPSPVRIPTTLTLRDARAHAPLPEPLHLVAIRARNVDTDGMIRPGGEMIVSFIHDGGADQAVRWTCADVTRDLDGWRSSQVTDQHCDADRRPPLQPRCAMHEIWTRAILDGASARDPATITLHATGWTFVTPSFEATYPDDC